MANISLSLSMLNQTQSENKYVVWYKNNIQAQLKISELYL